MSINPYESPDTASKPPEPKPSGPKFTLLHLLAILGALAILVALLLPARRSASEAGRRANCSNNLKQIGIALHNYHEKYKSLPPAYTVDADGKPLHSWRTLILPFVEQQALYDKIDLSKPWNDPANKAAYEAKIPAYHCPSDAGPPSQTTYLAVVAPNSCFPATGTKTLADITDGPSSTLMIIEVSPEHAVHWMSPTDASEQMVLDRGPPRKLAHPSGSHGLFADASTRLLSADLKPATLRAIISIAGDDNEAARAAD